MANINQLRNLIIALGLGDDSKTVHTFKHAEFCFSRLLTTMYYSM